MVTTKNYYKKYLVKKLFSETNYHKIKLIKILWDYLLGNSYDEIIKYLPNLISGTGTIFDVGANMGQYMCRLSKYFPSSTILSFEPISVNYYCLNKMMRILKLKNVETYQYAISDKIGNAIMVTPYIRGVPITTQSGLMDSVRYSNESGLAKIEVSTTTIDNLVLAKKLSNVILIKVDTEGAEDKVLRGAIQTITRFKPLLILETGMENVEVMKLIDIGYHAYYFDNKLIPFGIGRRRGDLILRYEQD